MALHISMVKSNPCTTTFPAWDRAVPTFSLAAKICPLWIYKYPRIKYKLLDRLVYLLYCSASHLAFWKFPKFYIFYYKMLLFVPYFSIGECSFSFVCTGVLMLQEMFTSTESADLSQSMPISCLSTTSAMANINYAFLLTMLSTGKKYQLQYK